MNIVNHEQVKHVQWTEVTPLVKKQACLHDLTSVVALVRPTSPADGSTLICITGIQTFHPLSQLLLQVQTKVESHQSDLISSSFSNDA